MIPLSRSYFHVGPSSESWAIQQSLEASGGTLRFQARNIGFAFLIDSLVVVYMVFGLGHISCFYVSSLQTFVLYDFHERFLFISIREGNCKPGSWVREMDGWARGPVLGSTEKKFHLLI